MAIGSESDETFVKSSLVKNDFTENDNPGRRGNDSVDASALSSSSKESLIESLMQKTDEMSSNFIKLQMKLESKEEEYKEDLIKAKEEAFSEGMEAGIAKAAESTDDSHKSSINQFSSSVSKLEEIAKEF